MQDSLGDRLKRYEATTKLRLLRRTPVIIRLDGKAFHTYTKQFNTANDPSLLESPFSHKLHLLMNKTMSGLMSYVQNAVFAYTQSDEISILLNDWKTLTTEQWDGAEVQKIVSHSAAMATGFFNFTNSCISTESGPVPHNLGGIPLFDARVFNLPFEEVTNYFIWRQNDATRNSINMYARHFFSQKQLHGKNTSEVQDMLMLEKQKNWNDLETWKRRGSCAYRKITHSESERTIINIDDNPPIFTKDRNYIEHYLDR